MNWHLITHKAASGKFNMEFDLELASSCNSQNAYFRLYRWEPYCISLGANQDFSDINSVKAERKGIDIVKRPTGGRAILHAEEVTYSIVVPTTIGYSAKEFYHKISIGLIRGLSLYNTRLAELKLEGDQPHFPSLLKESSGKLCFASTARNEIKYNGKKVVGSAQRKMNNVILQHGSILCGKFHRKLPDYINESEQLSLEQSTIEIETILNEQVDYSKLYESLINGMEMEWEVNFPKNNLTLSPSFSYSEEI